MPSLTHGHFTISEALRLCVLVYRHNWIRFSLASLAFYVVIAAIVFAIFGAAGIFDLRISGPTMTSDNAVGMVFVAIIGFFLCALIAFAPFQIFVTAISFEQIGGEKMATRPALSSAFRRFMPLVGLYLVITFIGLAVMLPILLFTGLGGAASPLIAVPLFILIGLPALFYFITLFYFATPILICEGEGIFRSVSRSVSLSKGVRWKIFATYLILAVLSFVISFLLGMAALVPGLAMASNIVSVVVQLILTVLSVTILVTTYYLARAQKEGFRPTDVAAVFE